MVEISRLTGLWFFTVDSHLLAQQHGQVSEIAPSASLRGTQGGRQVDLFMRQFHSTHRYRHIMGPAIGSLAAACKSRRIIESRIVKHKRKPGQKKPANAQLACIGAPLCPIPMQSAISAFDATQITHRQTALSLGTTLPNPPDHSSHPNFPASPGPLSPSTIPVAPRHRQALSAIQIFCQTARENLPKFGLLLYNAASHQPAGCLTNPRRGL